MKQVILLVSICLLSKICVFSQKTDFPELTGPYLGQKPPGMIPEVFAPDYFEQFDFVRDVAFTPDGNEFYFTLIENDNFSIMYSYFDSSAWTIPAKAFFSSEFNDFEPCISVDGKEMYFVSSRLTKEKQNMDEDCDIWRIKKTGDKWSAPEPLDSNINTECMEYYPSVTKKGRLYFERNNIHQTRGDIYCSNNQGKGFEEPQILPKIVNLPNSSFNAFIAPDESYLIFSTYIQTDSLWHSDLFISFKDKNEDWGEPQNLGIKINTLRNEYSPWVSHDGKYFFYSSSEAEKGKIYWISTKIIEGLKSKL